MDPVTGSRRRRGSRLPAGVLGALALAGFLAPVAVLVGTGTAGAASSAPSLGLTARTVPHGSPAIEIVARFAEPGGATPTSPHLAGVTISFSLHVREFSGSPVLVLGSATTDVNGEAIFTYEPTWTGRQELVGSATNAAGSTLAVATARVVATTATHPLAADTEALRPDGTIGRVVVGVLLATAALLWIVLLAVVVRVYRGLTGRPSPR